MIPGTNHPELPLCELDVTNGGRRVSWEGRDTT
jgi:hypothetical protein